MAITPQQFDALVARLEKSAARHPGLYKLRLGAFATLGYLYILVVVLLLLVAAGFILVMGKALAAKLAIALLVLVGVALRSLWVKIEPPTGLTLAREDHPALFAAIEEIRSAAKAPRANVVLLTNDFNAAISQVPRLGMFGWQKNYLLLGLPLMLILSLDELRAVLAHEFGHLSGAHGRFGAWIYRLRTSWSRLAETLRARKHWGSPLFVPFFDWFAPKFAAYSFVQARMQEYEADRAAAARHGGQALANALIRSNLKAQDLAQSYWPSVYKAADELPAPANAPFRGLLGAESRGFLPSAPEQLRHELERETSTADTHPCLRDRIAALNAVADVPPPPEVSAAAALLGARLGGLVEHFDAEWQKNVAEWWTSRHRHVQTGRQKLEAYAAKPIAELTDDELFEYGRLAEEFVAVSKAAELFKALVERGTRHLGGRYADARLRLREGDETGIAALEEIMKENAAAVPHACEVIVEYLHSHGRDAEAQPYIERYHRHRQSEHARRAERNRIRTTDQYEAHSLTAKSYATLKQELAKRADVEAAYVVRKVLPAGEPPVHVVGVKRRTRRFRFETNDADSRLIKALANEIALADNVLYISVGGQRKSFAKLFGKVPGSRIK